MAAEMGARRRRGLGGLRALWGERARAYGRAVLLGAVIAAALAGLAAHAVDREVNTGTILLFASEHWPFWLAGTGLALVAGALAGRFAPRPRTAGDEDLPAHLPAAEVSPGLATGP